MKKLLAKILILGLLMAVFPFTALAGQTDVVSLGANLTEQQKEDMFNLFGVNENEVNVIDVTIKEVKEHLSGIATDSQIGTKAISSAYVKLLPEGEGINVETQNITWVTKEMYANAMVTAGLKDAEVIVAAPFNVSGTTALTGIMKAFEVATGEKLTDAAKKTANEELVLTGDIGKDIGKTEAVKLIQNVKKEVTKREIKNPEDIRKLIKDIANELNISLNDEQINQILGLMEKISRLDLNVDKISKQLDKISSNLEIVKNTVEENKGILQQILDAISSFLKRIFG